LSNYLSSHSLYGTEKCQVIPVGIVSLPIFTAFHNLDSENYNNKIIRNCVVLDLSKALIVLSIKWFT